MSDSLFDNPTDKLCDALSQAVSGHSKAADVAQAVYGVLRQFATDDGQNPDTEVFIRAPGEPRHFSDATCWVVGWEAGPYEWAIGASFVIMNVTNKLVEPYYSFDLCFYPSED